MNPYKPADPEAEDRASLTINKGKNMKFKIRTRDWKGSYDSSTVGWKLFASEDTIETGQDCFAEVFCKGEKCTLNIKGQEIYDIHETILCGEDVAGYDLDEKNDSILIKL